MTRAEKVAEAQRLRGEGLIAREIAERMGVARTTVQAWFTDPDLSKQRARRKRYQGRCVDCGKPTDGSNGRASAPERCFSCTNAKAAAEGRDHFIREIRRFAAMYGRPPVATDWSPALARAKCVPEHAAEVAARYERDGWPSSDGTRRAFGTWNAAIRAAGFTPRPRGVRGPDWRDTEEAVAA